MTISIDALLDENKALKARIAELEAEQTASKIAFLSAESIELPAAGVIRTAYMAANRTSALFFEDRGDAGKYAGLFGAAAGIDISEIQIMPKGYIVTSHET